jgi:hypothetical protein
VLAVDSKPGSAADVIKRATVRKLRSLEAFTKAVFLNGLNSEAAEYLGTRRKEAVAALVAVDLKRGKN